MYTVYVCNVYDTKPPHGTRSDAVLYPFGVLSRACMRVWVSVYVCVCVCGVCGVFASIEKTRGRMAQRGWPTTAKAEPYVHVRLRHNENDDDDNNALN